MGLTSNKNKIRVFFRNPLIARQEDDCIIAEQVYLNIIQSY